MRSLLIARGRVTVICASAALIGGLAGCTRTAATGSSVAGSRLTIYVSKPAGVLTAQQQDVLSAEQLALQKAGGHAGKFTVKLVQCPGPTGCGGSKLSDNARAAIADPTTIAYIGELEPGASGQTIGITNAQDVLQVSPADTAVELTQAVPEDPGSPDRYYESLSTNGRTFGRVVPTDRLEAKALVTEMQALGVKRLYVAGDGSAYGKALAGLLHIDAGSVASATSLSGADGVVYAGNSAVGAAEVFNQAASSNPSVKLFATSALAQDSFVGGLSAAAQHDLYVSSPGFTTTDLPPQGSQFVAAFKTAYGHAPATGAIFGYEAVAAVLAALQKAGNSANSRGTVVKDFFAIRNRTSPVGTYSINRNGDISFASGAPFVFSHVKSGKLVPLKAVQQQG
jgi:ABC-type branched-subunit amino acid transport system substrate-binding protein